MGVLALASLLAAIVLSTNAYKIDYYNKNPDQNTEWFMVHEDNTAHSANHHAHAAYPVSENNQKPQNQNSNINTSPIYPASINKFKNIFNKFETKLLENRYNDFDNPHTRTSKVFQNGESHQFKNGKYQSLNTPQIGKDYFEKGYDYQFTKNPEELDGEDGEYSASNTRLSYTLDSEQKKLPQEMHEERYTPTLFPTQPTNENMDNLKRNPIGHASEGKYTPKLFSTKPQNDEAYSYKKHQQQTQDKIFKEVFDATNNMKNNRRNQNQHYDSSESVEVTPEDEARYNQEAEAKVESMFTKTFSKYEDSAKGASHYIPYKSEVIPTQQEDGAAEVHYHQHKHVHKHKHTQDHKHNHEQEHLHAHLAQSKHEHKHEEDHKHDHQNKHDHSHKHQQQHNHNHHNDHKHNHAHKHSHQENHKHNHNEDHKHKHDHHHGHGHDHDHHNDHKHDHHHGHKESHHEDHKHDHHHGHNHGHKHWEQHGHKHGHKHGHDNKHTHGHKHSHVVHKQAKW